ncbi:MAG: hypothetical protein K8H88_06365 [Sandaracinaceae bacterium]|nr:hypothetical protein [Sandaracinaceae bacterium]
MKTAMGTNVKVIVSEAVRPKLGAMFEALGVLERKSPGPQIDVYTLHDGGNLGFFFQPEALDEHQLAGSVWLEVRVDDPDGAARALDALAIPRVDYMDKSHVYFRAPGGLVFRLAPLG